MVIVTGSHTQIMNNVQDYIYDICAIGRRIRLLRELKHVSQRTVSEAVGIPRDRFSKIEKGHAGLSPEMMMRLADYFEVSLDYLYFGKAGDAQFRNQLLEIAVWLCMLAGEDIGYSDRL